MVLLRLAEVNHHWYQLIGEQHEMSDKNVSVVLVFGK